MFIGEFLISGGSSHRKEGEIISSTGDSLRKKMKEVGANMAIKDKFEKIKIEKGEVLIKFCLYSVPETYTRVRDKKVKVTRKGE
jgi:hypothetical protein